MDNANANHANATTQRTASERVKMPASAQKENTIKVRFPEGLEKSFIIHTKFPARPTFEDDEQVVEAFTEYDRLTREIQGLKKLLEIEKAKVQTTIL